MKLFQALFTVCAILSVASTSLAERRFALLVGHPRGGDPLTPLRYVNNDLDRVEDVLALGGGFADDDIRTLESEDADALEAAFFELRETILEHRQRTGEPTLFLLYYSGHTLNGELRLGESRLPLSVIKDFLEESGAELRIALIDSCRAGEVTQLKGATVGPPVRVDLNASTERRGQVIITASSATEDAQESDAIQGSFFTYYLTSGLRGAADRNGDGTVTLSEAYSHAYSRTVSRTIGTRGGTQHPSYRFDIHGADDVVMTRWTDGQGFLTFPGAEAGRFVVFDSSREVIIAEFDKESGEAMQIGVSPGSYVVKKRLTNHLMMQDVEVVSGHAQRVESSEMRKVAFDDDYAKGAIVKVGELMGTEFVLQVGSGLVSQTFLSTPVRDDYFPRVSLVELYMSFDNLIAKDWGLRLDLSIGASDPTQLQLTDPYLGNLSYTVKLEQGSVGVGLVREIQLRSWMKLRAHARLGLIGITRSFVDEAIPDQFFATMTPGLGVEWEIPITSWLRGGVSARVHYMFFQVDEPMSLAFMDMGFSLTAVMP